MEWGWGTGEYEQLLLKDLVELDLGGFLDKNICVGGLLRLSGPLLDPGDNLRVPAQRVGSLEDPV